MKMKKIYKVLWLSVGISIYLLTYSHSYATEEFLMAIVFQKEGEPIVASKIHAQHEVYGLYKGKKVKVPFKKISKIENMGNQVIRLTRDDSKVFVLKKAQLYNGLLYFHYYDDISQQERSGEKNFKKNITIIEFKEKIGTIKYNSRTMKYYPGEYIFDPFTGEKLAWGDQD
jgi:hypothetical protein